MFIYDPTSVPNVSAGVIPAADQLEGMPRAEKSMQKNWSGGENVLNV